ncbi:hypothetical protein DMH17_10300 [Raoultella planticola]|nr:hypothetical protein [Raoultella planticola]
MRGFYITGVTDHHKNAVPQTSRARHRCLAMANHAVSCLARQLLLYSPIAMTILLLRFQRRQPGPHAVAEGWRRSLPRAIADPLNPQSWKGGRGHAVSALELPLAPEQPGWSLRNAPYQPPVH